MKFNEAIDKIMPDVESGSNEPFIVYRDKNGGWHCDYTQNQYGKTFDWVEDVKKQDPLAEIFIGKNFAKSSFSEVYDILLCDRIRSEYNIALSSGKADDNLHALICFFNNESGAFSHEFTSYLTTLERPLAVLEEMCPSGLAANYFDYIYSPNKAAELVAHFEHETKSRLNSQHGKEVLPKEAPQKIKTKSKPRQKPSLLGRLADAKKEAAAHNAERKQRGTSPKAKRGAERED